MNERTTGLRVLYHGKSFNFYRSLFHNLVRQCSAHEYRVDQKYIKHGIKIRLFISSNGSRWLQSCMHKLSLCLQKHVEHPNVLEAAEEPVVLARGHDVACTSNTMIITSQYDAAIPSGSVCFLRQYARSCMIGLICCTPEYLQSVFVLLSPWWFSVSGHHNTLRSFRIVRFFLVCCHELQDHYFRHISVILKTVRICFAPQNSGLRKYGAQRRPLRSRPLPLPPKMAPVRTSFV